MSNDREFFINLDRVTLERFDMGKFHEFTDNYDPLTSRLINTVQNLPERQKYFIQSEECRPDIISFKAYGSTQYWWIILIYNDIDDIDDVQIGRILSLPSLPDLEDLFFSLRAKEVANTL